MNRRTLLKQAGLFGPVLVTFNPILALQRSVLNQLSNFAQHTDRVLVLIQLNGGNDSLNSFIPLSNYDTLIGLRKNIIIPEDRILPLEGTSSFGFHPALNGLRDLYNDGKLSIIHGVGYPNPDLSHFKAINIKLTANCGEKNVKSGWIGRYLNHEFPQYSNHPSWHDRIGPPCLRIGEVSPVVSLGEKEDLGIGFSNIEDLNFEGPDLTNDPISDTMSGKTISHIRDLSKQFKMYAPIIQEALNRQANLSKLYNSNGDSQKYTRNSLNEQLKTVARLIGGGLGSKVYVVCQNGYDTHANQVEKSNSTMGHHAELLQNLSDAITAFEDDLRLMGKQDQVLGMTFSEFGRRINSSDSFGTDHGTTDSVMLFGSKLKQRMIGQESLTSFNLSDENLEMKYDFRTLYASILEGWLGISKNAIGQILPEAPSGQIDLFS
jgi:uncharacterized protein (DUF1501 family)